MKSWKLFLLIIALSFFPLIDIFRTPNLPHTSDGIMHIVRFAAYYKELINGQFPVRWASQINYGYGSPMFIFYYPLPYIIGALFVATKLPLILILKINFAITYILAGIFMLLFSLAFFKEKKTSFFVAIMYQYAPFRLVEMLVRGSLGSLYTYMFVPLLFYAITRSIQKRTYSNFILLTISTAFILMSHNVLGFSFLGLAVLFILFLTQNIKKIIWMLFSIIWGLLIISFYLIPAILEHKYTNGYLFTKDLFYLNFPKLYTFFIPNITNIPQLRTAEVSVQIGLFHIFAFLIIIFLLIKNKLSIAEKLFTIFLLSTSTLTILFMQPISKPIWENISLVRQFQFPWRFLAIICFTSALASSFMISHFKFFQKKLIYVALITLVILSTIFYWSPYQGYQKISQEYFWNYHLSASYFGEFNTIWMAHESTQYPKKRVDIVAGTVKIYNIKLSPTKHSFTVDSHRSSTLVDKIYFYPGWRVFIDNVPVPIQFQDQNYRGLITFNIPSGKHAITVTYRETQIQKLGNIITIITIISLFAGFFIYPKLKIKS